MAHGGKRHINGPSFFPIFSTLSDISRLARFSHRLYPDSRSGAQPGIYNGEPQKATYTPATCIMPRGRRASPRASERAGRMSFVVLMQYSARPTGLEQYFN